VIGITPYHAYTCNHGIVVAICKSSEESANKETAVPFLFRVCTLPYKIAEEVAVQLTI
jgi:hypothetical protein